MPPLRPFSAKAPRKSLRKTSLLFGFQLLSSLPGFAAEGPGVPNIDYDPSLAGANLSIIDPSKAVSSITMHRGYLFVPLAADDGGGMGDGAFAFYNIQNPSSPVKIFDSRDNPAKYHTSTGKDYVGDWAEIHHMNVSGDLFLTAERRPGSSGFSIFDSSPLYDDDPETSPNVVSRYSFPGITSSNNYDGFAFAPGWQGKRFVYAPTGANGLYVVDTKNLANPTLSGHFTPSQLGGLYARGAWPIGNLLILAEATVLSNFKAKVFDISEPGNPVLLSSFQGPFGYHGFVYGSSFYNATNPLMAFDFSNPSNVTSTTLATAEFHNPEYGFGRDGNLYIGHYPGSMKFKLNGSSAPFVARVNSGLNDDHAFLNPVGNLLALCSDHNNNRRVMLCVDSTEKDTTPPEPLFTSPSDGATQQSIQSRIGISFSDFIDPMSLSSATMEVRNVGTGELVAGTYSAMMGIVNFAPDEPLSLNATYDVVLKAGGIKDQVGNAIPSESRVIRFTTGSQISQRTVSVRNDQPIAVGQSAAFSLEISNAGSAALEHSWDFGDGTPATSFSSSLTASHTYQTPGNFNVTVRTRIVGQSYAPAATATQIVHRAAVSKPPVSQSTILSEPSRKMVWNVNPDNDSVSAINTETYQKIREISVGGHPVALSFGSADRLWVLNEKSSTLTVIARETGTVAATYALPPASAPRGLVVDPNQPFVYVTLEARNQLVKISEATGAIVATLPLPSHCRGLAIDAERGRLWISRFISPDTGAEVLSANLSTFTLESTATPLANVMETDGLKNGRGLPNYLAPLSISPDGTQAYVPSKKDNIFRGLKRDGLPLTFEHSVRSMAANIDLATSKERTAFRIDFDNSDFATAAAWSPMGNMVFFTTNGSSSVWAVNAYEPTSMTAFHCGGIAPDGLALAPQSSLLFVHNFMDRSVTIFRPSTTDGSFTGSMMQVAKVATVSTEALSPQVLLGKQLFYRTDDARLAQEGYMSCASCHLDGGEDGRVWDFTNFGEGFRNTITLNGRGVGHGPAHWSGNFDETQDFEGQIRTLAQGTGFLPDRTFLDTSVYDALGSKKAGLSAELDALAAYVGSLTTTGISPQRLDNGSLTANAAAGREIFRRENCAACHTGTAFTDSALFVRHDVGTLAETSGERLGNKLDGLDTPTLRGLWRTAPYLHDGSAATLREVLVDRNLGGKHANLFHCTPAEIDQLIDYLGSIDDLEQAAPSNADGTPAAITGNLTLESPIFVALTQSYTATGTAPFSWSAISLPPGLEIDPVTGVIRGAPSKAGTYPAQISVRDANGRSTTRQLSWVVKDPFAFRYAKFSALSTYSGLQITCLGEFHLLDSAGVRLNRHRWKVTASTEETVGEMSPVSSAVDSMDHTYWHSNYSSPPFPHDLIVDLGSPQAIHGVELLTRQGNTSGRTKDYRISLSNDGVNWNEFVFQGTLPNTDTWKQAMFTTVTNQPPAFSSSQEALSVTENSSAGTIVGTVTASDPNAGQTLTYQLGSGNIGGAFTINSTTGQIRTQGPIDYETIPLYNLQVIATDNAATPYSTSIVVPISVNNVIEDNREAVFVALTSAGGAFAGQGNPQLIDFSADPDQDGLSNAIELLLGTDPTTANAQPPIRIVPVTQNGENYFAWEYTLASGSGLKCELQSSEDMVHWQSLQQAPVLIGTSNGLSTYRVRDDLPARQTTRRFMRMSVN